MDLQTRHPGSPHTHETSYFRINRACKAMSLPWWTSTGWVVLLSDFTHGRHRLDCTRAMVFYLLVQSIWLGMASRPVWPRVTGSNRGTDIGCHCFTPGAVHSESHWHCGLGLLYKGSSANSHSTGHLQARPGYWTPLMLVSYGTGTQ